jgi:hypothetical protein
MRLAVTCVLLIFRLCLIGQSQISAKSPVDPALAKKITIGGFCLCQTSLEDLKKLSGHFAEIEVEEMDLPIKCLSQDARFENGKGYYSKDCPGLIFQKDQITNFISKIRLTKDFKGNLPDGTLIDLQALTLNDVFKVYPSLVEKWSSRGCSDYWNISNDTISFFVKIDPSKKPQYPVDEAYYSERKIEAIDIKISCYDLFKKANNRYRKLLNEPVMFVDSVNVTSIELQKYQPTEIATVTIYKDSNAIRLVGPQGKDGVAYIETKNFARNKYWNFLKSKSQAYLKVVPEPQENSLVIYILNDKILRANFEGDLSVINDETFIDLKIIGKEQLFKEYNIDDKSYGILIRTNLKK